MKRWKMKAGLRLLLAASLIVVAIGCGGTEDDGGGGTGGTAGSGGSAGQGGTGGTGGTGGEAGQGGSGGTGGTGGTGGSSSSDPLCDQEPTWEAFAQPLVQRDCLSCHSINVTGAARQRAPVGVNFDTEADLRGFETRVLREVRSGAMPPGNPEDDCVVTKLEAFFNQ